MTDYFETENTAFWRPNGTGVSRVNTINLKAWVKIKTLKTIAKIISSKEFYKYILRFFFPLSMD